MSNGGDGGDADRDDDHDDVYVPPFDDPARKSNLTVATFNLVATIVGAGVLSLPLAFEKAGLVPATLLMVFAAVITDFSMHLLCSCAVKTGATNFGEVFLLTFGRTFERNVTALLFVFLMFVQVAFYVLVRNIWTPIFDDLFLSSWLSNDVDEVTKGNLVLFVILVGMSPFMLKEDLYALRHNCYVGFTSISVLCVALVYRAVQKCLNVAEDGSTTPENAIKWIADDFSDVLYAVPFIVLAFLASFNVVPVQAALIEPTPKRMFTVVRSSLTACFVLMYTFGLAGYLYARSEVKGNILLNFPVGDYIIILGRIGSGVTLIMALPMMHLPCRHAILELLATVVAVDDHGNGNAKRTSEPRPPHETSSLLPASIIDDHDERTHVGDGFCRRTVVVTTFVVVSVCYVFAAGVPGVAVVWSVCGSSMAFLIAFILPCWAFVELFRSRSDPRTPSATALLVGAVAGSVGCTIQTVAMMRRGSD